MRIQPDHEALQYTGRIDFSDRKAPVFVFTCTSVGMRFTGSLLKIYGKNKKAYWDNYLGYILDGKQGCIRLSDEGETVCTVLNGDGADDTEENQEHEILLFKRQDACHEVTFLGFEIADGGRVLKLPEVPERRIEVYGDSVSAGEVSEAVAYTGREDPQHNGEFSNSWFSYAWMTARKLNAQIHDIAQGGIALMDGTGWFCAPEYVGMESVWDKVHYNPGLGEATSWNFSDYIPHVVVVAIGQNDSNPSDYMKDYDGARAVLWRERYAGFIRRIRINYPDAWIVCCTTLLQHDAAWDRAISQVCRQLGDERVRHFLFRRNGTGTPGHLRIAEAEEMAEELSAYIETLLTADGL